MRSVDDRTRRRAGGVADLGPRPPQWHVQLSDWHGPEGLQAVLDVARDGQLHFWRVVVGPKENEKRFISRMVKISAVKREISQETRPEAVNGSVIYGDGPSQPSEVEQSSLHAPEPGHRCKCQSSESTRSFELIIGRRRSFSSNKLLMSKQRQLCY